MKKIILLAAVLTALFVSCTKETSVEQESIRLTLIASIDDVATRATYTDDHGLKMSWAEEEAISIVTIVNGYETNLQTLTSTGTAGRDKAVFTGTFTPTDGAQYIAVYPAMDDLYGDYWCTPGQHFRIDKGSPYLSWRAPNASNLCQTVNGSPNHISALDAMVGHMTIADGQASTRLIKTLSVLKLNLTLPDDDTPGNLSCVQVGTYQNGPSITTGHWHGISFSDPFCWLGGGAWFVQMGLDIDVPLQNEENLVIYIPGAYGSLPGDEDITITIEKDAESAYTKTIHIADELPMEPGYLYTINAQMEKINQ